MHAIDLHTHSYASPDGGLTPDDYRHMLEHGPSPWRQTDPGVPSLEQRQPQLVFEPGDVAADRRRADARGLGRPSEVAGRRRSRQIFQVADFHGSTSAFACQPEPEWGRVSRDDSSGGCHADRLFLKQCVMCREMTH